MKKDFTNDNKAERQEEHTAFTIKIRQIINDMLVNKVLIPLFEEQFKVEKNDNPKEYQEFMGFIEKKSFSWLWENIKADIETYNRIEQHNSGSKLFKRYCRCVGIPFADGDSEEMEVPYNTFVTKIIHIYDVLYKYQPNKEEEDQNEHGEHRSGK
jgi:hypothetical protein